MQQDTTKNFSQGKMWHYTAWSCNSFCL